MFVSPLPALSYSTFNIQFVLLHVTNFSINSQSLRMLAPAADSINATILHADSSSIAVAFKVAFPASSTSSTSLFVSMLSDPNAFSNQLTVLGVLVGRPQPSNVVVLVAPPSASTGNDLGNLVGSSSEPKAVVPKSGSSIGVTIGGAAGAVCVAAAAIVILVILRRSRNRRRRRRRRNRKPAQGQDAPAPAPAEFPVAKSFTARPTILPFETLADGARVAPSKSDALRPSSPSPAPEVASSSPVARVPSEGSVHSDAVVAEEDIDIDLDVSEIGTMILREQPQRNRSFKISFSEFDQLS